jgi:hypothetical protein
MLEANRQAQARYKKRRREIADWALTHPGEPLPPPPRRGRPPRTAQAAVSTAENQASA